MNSEKKMDEICCPSCKKTLRCCNEYNDHYKYYLIKKLNEVGDEIYTNGNYPLDLYRETGVIKENN